MDEKVKQAIPDGCYHIVNVKSGLPARLWPSSTPPMIGDDDGIPVICDTTQTKDMGKDYALWYIKKEAHTKDYTIKNVVRQLFANARIIVVELSVVASREAALWYFLASPNTSGAYEIVLVTEKESGLVWTYKPYVEDKEETKEEIEQDVKRPGPVILEANKHTEAQTWRLVKVEERQEGVRPEGEE